MMFAIVALHWPQILPVYVALIVLFYAVLELLLPRQKKVGLQSLYIAY